MMVVLFFNGNSTFLQEHIGLFFCRLVICRSYFYGALFASYFNVFSFCFFKSITDALNQMLMIKSQGQKDVNCSSTYDVNFIAKDVKLLTL